jgi:hypothetical protein
LEKLMYLVWLPEGTTPARAGEVMLGDVAPALVAAGVRALTIDVDDEPAQVPPPAPPPDDENPVRAVVSLWLDAYDWRAPFEDVLHAHSERIAGYQAVESMYRDYGDNKWSARRDWPDGTRSPGVLTVSLIEQKRDMDFDDWITFWHTKQSPMSEAIQPRARYVRNALFRAITPDSPPYRAIVEESWPTVDDLTDPMRFYCANGDAVLLQRNVTTMLDHVTTFIDFDTFRNYTLSEWIIKSL